MGLGDGVRVTKPVMVTLEEAYVEDMKSSITRLHKEYKKVIKDAVFLASLLQRIKMMYPPVFHECILREDFKNLSDMADLYLTDLSK